LLTKGKPIALGPKTYDTLLLLVQNRGRMLSKEELMKALWPDSFVEESNLTQQVSMRL
jgi:DNA-binding winged helix-turn-helix (wHTH) protein